MRPFLHSQQPFNLDTILFFNQIFEDFLQQCFSFSLAQLGPSLTYVIQYLSLPLTYELPSASTNPNHDQII